MAELLLELLSEEIPARMQARAADDIRRLVGEGLAAHGLAFADARSFVTPRRLTLVVDGLPVAQPDVTEEKRGPRVGAPQQAVDGFLKSAGVTLDQCEQRDAGKGAFWFAVVDRKGRPTAEILSEIILGALHGFPWPKSMRWGSSTFRWVRPLHSVLAIFNGKPVGGRLSIGPAIYSVPPLAAGPTSIVPGSDIVLTKRVLDFENLTRGHRFLAPEAFLVGSFSEYQTKLRAAKVILDAAERREMIAGEARRLAAVEGLTVRPDDGLLHEVAGLVEWPVVRLGSIDEAFMDVPAEVLITAMRTHQKYFSLLGPDGALAPRFVVVANTETSDGGAEVVAGNQRVLRARLSDAKFFWDTDRRHSLESRLPKLAERLFYAGLGTVADKTVRLQRLARHLTFYVNGADVADAVRAAELCKADLATEMVGEFPELQGVMGRYYALHDGEAPAVAEGIAEHYSPVGPNDRCPTAPVSVAVALADKLDSLVGFFGIDEKPTGSKDPFALRRAALGVVRLIIENRLRLPLVSFFALAHAEYGGGLARSADETGADLLDFFADRLKVHLRESGTRHDLVNAVFSLGGEDDLVRLLARVAALKDFLATEDGANLLVAYRRAANIVRIEEKRDAASHRGAVDPGLLELPEERSLLARLDAAKAEFAPALQAERFGEAMAALAGLRQPVDAFFDRVTVNVDVPSLRANRLRLLSQIVATMGEIADFSKIEG